LIATHFCAEAVFNASYFEQHSIFLRRDAMFGRSAEAP
jgi:hypothetical protein